MTTQQRANQWLILSPEERQAIIKARACHFLVHVEAKRWLAENKGQPNPNSKSALSLRFGNGKAIVSNEILFSYH